MQQWAADELRSVNAQIEYLLRDALREAGRTEKRVIEPVLIDDEGDESCKPPRID